METLESGDDHAAHEILRQQVVPFHAQSAVKQVCYDRVNKPVEHADIVQHHLRGSSTSVGEGDADAATSHVSAQELERRHREASRPRGDEGFDTDSESDGWSATSEQLYHVPALTARALVEQCIVERVGAGTRLAYGPAASASHGPDSNGKTTASQPTDWFYSVDAAWHALFVPARVEPANSLPCIDAAASSAATPAGPVTARTFRESEWRRHEGLFKQLMDPGSSCTVAVDPSAVFWGSRLPQYLAGLLLTTASPADVRTRACWSGTNGTSRQSIVKLLEYLVGSEHLVPLGRLPTLLRRAVVLDRLVHETLPGDSNQSTRPSLLVDPPLRLQLPTRLLRRLYGMQEPVWRVSVSPSGRWCLGGGGRSGVALWDLHAENTTGECLSVRTYLQLRAQATTRESRVRTLSSPSVRWHDADDDTSSSDGGVMASVSQRLRGMHADARGATDVTAVGLREGVAAIGWAHDSSAVVVADCAGYVVSAGAQQHACFLMVVLSMCVLQFCLSAICA